MIGSTLTFSSAAPAWEATISTNQQEMNLATWATGQGWNGTSEALITIASGVYIWSDDIATPALTTGDFPNGLTLIVEGFIIGKGGRGGGGVQVEGNAADLPAEDGGVAISLGCDCTIEGGASAYIGGGGGGGGYGPRGQTGGGGAGGGDGGDAGPITVDQNGGIGGAVGAAGGNGDTSAPAHQGPGFGGGAGGGGAGEFA